MDSLKQMVNKIEAISRAKDREKNKPNENQTCDRFIVNLSIISWRGRSLLNVLGLFAKSRSVV